MKIPAQPAYLPESVSIPETPEPRWLHCGTLSHRWIYMENRIVDFKKHKQATHENLQESVVSGFFRAKVQPSNDKILFINRWSCFCLPRTRGLMFFSSTVLRHFQIRTLKYVYSYMAYGYFIFEEPIEFCLRWKRDLGCCAHCYHQH